MAIALWGLDRGGMWRDEAVTFQVGRRTVPQIWRLLHDVDAVHGLYYLVMHPVLAVHPGEVVLRLPSACAAAVTAALVAALGTHLVRPRVGLWAGLLYAVAPMAGHYAQEGRSYALVAAGATGAALLFVRAVRTGSWWAYGTVLGVTCWLHEFAVLLLLAHAVSLALARAGGAVWRGWGRAAVAVALSLLPMVLVSRGQAAQVAWLRRPTADTAEGLLRLFLGPADGVYRVCLGLALLGLAGLVRRRGELTCAGVALPLAVVPPGVLMLLSQISPLYVDRYVLYALGGAPLLVACGAERVARVAGRLWAERPAGVAVRARRRGRAGRRPSAQPSAEPLSGLVPLGGAVPPTGSAARFDLVPPPDPAPHGDPVPASGPAVPAAPRRRVPVGAVAGVAAVVVVLLQQLPLLQADRSPGRRPDDLAAVSRIAARALRPGDPVLFLPVQTRNVALTYPGAFRGTRDVALVEGAAASGTLYGREAGPDELRRRLARLDRLRVVADQALLAGGWTPRNAAERAKLAVLRTEFVPGEETVREGVTVRLYVRRASGRPPLPPLPPLPPTPPRPARG
ncbi:glycosyltransferase family 39 protein [Streptomyces sp900105245]|uniref:glycosyltransferase family 39 protein n=1 Tax=Streptomyces sp. 900105245 TaxID=3154379 RepID=UPI00331DBD5F